MIADFKIGLDKQNRINETMERARQATLLGIMAISCVLTVNCYTIPDGERNEAACMFICLLLLLSVYLLGGAVVEWLERPGYGAESRRKVVTSRLGFAMRRLEISLSTQQ